MPQASVAIAPSVVNYEEFLLNDASDEFVATHMFCFATASSCLPWREAKHFIENDLKGKSSQVQGYKKTKPTHDVKVITHVSILTQKF